MTTLTDLERLTRAAIDALERTRRGELDQMALLDARSVELVSVHGKRVLAMLRVIEAAKAMRHYFPHIPTQDFRHGDITAAFDAALAALDKEQK